MRNILLFIPLIALAACNQPAKNINQTSSANVANEAKPTVTNTNSPITSGSYDEALNLAYNPATKQVTGYFEMERGDNGSGGSQFSCIFYIEGKLDGNKAKVKTYFQPDDRQPKIEDEINGTLTRLGDSRIGLKLDEDHGGCSMTGVESFKDTAVVFPVIKKEPWVAIKYINADKAYFYNDKADASKRKAYLLKGNIVYIEKTEGNWLYASYLNADQKATKGWIKTSDTNTLN